MLDLLINLLIIIGIASAFVMAWALMDYLIKTFFPWLYSKLYDILTSDTND